MHLELSLASAANYKSSSQVARVVTEQWAAVNLYCPACDSNRITREPPNTRAIDFKCPKCDELFQLKSGRSWNQKKVVDAGYESMVSAIRGALGQAFSCCTTRRLGMCKTSCSFHVFSSQNQ
ncbi:MAG: hypothetical protein FJ249_01190 [Nitrospira sp.]|nr:hypothetical protein [Nitrospira sp.]